MKFWYELTKSIKYRKKIHSVKRRMQKSIFIPHNVLSEARLLYSKLSKVPFSTMWHKSYPIVNNIISSEYVPEDIFYSVIEKKLNIDAFSLAYSDKNIYGKMFYNASEDFTIFRFMNGLYYTAQYELIKESTAIEMVWESINKHGSVFVKPSIYSGGGKNVDKYLLSCYKRSGSKRLFNDIKKISRYGYVCQYPIHQHEVLSSLHDESVNTLRVVSLSLNNKISVCSSVLRIGRNKSYVDNQAAGGISVGVSKNGGLNNIAVDKYGSVYCSHPTSKLRFSDIIIPGYSQAISTVLRMHQQLPYFKMISWDLAISPTEEPIVIEINIKGQEINFHQFNNGPLFSDRTNEVIEFCNKKYLL